MKKFLSYFGLFFLVLLTVFSLEACGGGGGGSSSGGGGGVGGGGSNRVTFTGTVTHNGVGVAGAAISVADMGGVVRGIGATDAGGSYNFSMIGFDTPNSTVKITFTASGLSTYQTTLTINKGQTYTVNAAL